MAQFFLAIPSQIPHSKKVGQGEQVVYLCLVVLYSYFIAKLASHKNLVWSLSIDTYILQYLGQINID